MLYVALLFDIGPYEGLNIAFLYFFMFFMLMMIAVIDSAKATASRTQIKMSIVHLTKSKMHDILTSGRASALAQHDEQLVNQPIHKYEDLN